MYKRWTPSSRRNRRRSGRRPRKAATQGADRTLLVAIGLVLLAAILLVFGIVVSSGEL